MIPKDCSMCLNLWENIDAKRCLLKIKVFLFSRLNDEVSAYDLVAVQDFREWSVWLVKKTTTEHTNGIYNIRENSFFSELAEHKLSFRI